MKKNIVLLVLFFLSLLMVEAQPPCSYVRNEIDPFTGKVVQFTTPQNIHNYRNTRISFSFARINDERLMIIDLYTNLTVCFRANNIIILSEEGEIFELVAMPTGGIIDCGKYYTDDIRKFRFLTFINDYLLRQAPKAIRFHATDGNVSITEFRGLRITPPNQIMLQSACIK